MNAWLTIYATAPFTIFLVMFGRPATRWWRDPAGVSVFVMSAVVVVVVLALAIGRYVFEWVPPAGAREFVYALVGTAGFVQLAVYLHTRAQYRRDTRAGAERRRRSDDRA